jgi:hypothetical protein
VKKERDNARPANDSQETYKKKFIVELAHMKRHREGKKEQIETGTMAQ